MKTYEIEETSGAFTGKRGRISYRIEAGTVKATDIDPEVLARLIGLGIAKKSPKTEREAS